MFFLTWNSLASSGSIIGATERLRSLMVSWTEAMRSGSIRTGYGLMDSDALGRFKLPENASMTRKWKSCLTRDKAQLFDAVF